MVDGYDEGGGDVRVAEKVALSTKASQVEDNAHLPHHPWGGGVEVVDEDVLMNILTLADERSKDERTTLFYS